MAGLRKRFSLVAVLLTSQVLVSIMSGLVLASAPRENTIIPGVFIGGIDVGGMPREQAVRLLDGVVKEKFNSGRILLKYQERQWSYKYSELGIGFDIPASVDKALEAGRKENAINGSITMFQTRYRPLHYPLVLDVKEEGLQSALVKVNREISSQAEDAVVTFNEGRVVLIPENAGKALQFSASMTRIKEALCQLDEGPINIVVRVTPPRLTSNDLEGIKDSLGIGLADFPRSGGVTPDKVRLAVNGLTGLLVSPGQIFSFNKMVGEKIKEDGYLSPVITGGRLAVKSDTGASRAASALYQAVVYAGLEVKERHAHFSAPGYIALGQDAAVTAGEFDLKFLNNTPNPVYIRASVMGNRISVNILGTKTAGQTVQVITHTLSGQKGSGLQEVQVQRIYYNHGMENKRELLSRDIYHSPGE